MRRSHLPVHCGLPELSVMADPSRLATNLTPALVLRAHSFGQSPVFKGYQQALCTFDTISIVRLEKQLWDARGPLAAVMVYSILFLPRHI